MHEPTRLEKRSLRTLPKLNQDFTAYCSEPMTYVATLIPKIRYTDEYGEYYSILRNTTYAYFEDRESASKAYDEELYHQEKRSEWYASEGRFVSTVSVNNKIQNIVDYGIQQHCDIHPVYTLDYHNELLQYLPEDFDFLDDKFYDPDRLEYICYRIGDYISKLDRAYQKTFGYQTFEEAKTHEPYLQRMHDQYSIQEVFSIHTENFSTFNAEDMIRQYIEQHLVLEVARGNVRYLELLDNKNIPYIPEVQRSIMRALYDQPAVTDHIDTSPLQWVVPTIDTLKADDVVWEHLRNSQNLKELCEKWKESL